MGWVADTPGQTTIALYIDDHAWLQKRQREWSFKNDTFITMPDLMHEFVQAMIRAEEGE